MASKHGELVQECKRLSESCLYTSTSFFIWLRVLRTTRTCLTTLGLILGGVAGWNILSGSERATLFVAFCALLAGLIPTIISSLKLEEHIEECKRLSADFKNLQDRFRQAALVWSKKPFEEFEKTFVEARDRLEAARGGAITPPEWVFRRAQKKVKSTDYDFGVDMEAHT